MAVGLKGATREAPLVGVGAYPAASWGARALKGLPRGWQRALLRARLGYERIEPVAPVLAVALVLLATAVGFYFRQEYQIKPGTAHLEDSFAGFADLSFGGAGRLGIRRLALNDIGYDGQFYYYIAYRPSVIVDCAQRPAVCPMNDPSFRMQRILYPAAAELLSLGRGWLLPFALLAINFAAILVTVWLVGALCVAAGASRWLGAAAGLFGGELMGFLHDLADPFSVMWVVLAVYLARRGRPLWAALAVAAALLTREALLFYLPLLALPLLAERRWRTLAASAVIALGPFFAWQLTLRALYGKWPLLDGSTGAAQLDAIPFLGLLQEQRTNGFGLIVMTVAVPLVAAMVVGLRAIWQHGPRDLLRDPAPLMALVYCGLLSLTYWYQWADIWAPTRLAAPGVVLGVLVAARLPGSGARTTYGWLLAATALTPWVTMLQWCPC